VEEIVLKWDAVKKAEKPERTNYFEGIPDALPALARAHKILDRAERAGLSPLVGEGALVGLAETSLAEPQTEAQLGELLLAVVSAARSKGLDAERALRGAVRRFQEQVPPGS
jgi:uncharacterized protein YabN with tetrapyrrole methylase and pyrophosphatase domain